MEREIEPAFDGSFFGPQNREIVWW